MEQAGKGGDLKSLAALMPKLEEQFRNLQESFKETR